MRSKQFFSAQNRTTAAIVLAIAIGVTVLAQFTASQIQTHFGAVQVDNTRFSNEAGIAVRGKLFKPHEVSPSNRAPGIVFAHGYQSTRETGDAIAIELSRRGFVVLSIDTIGRGNSGPPRGNLQDPAFDTTFGTRAAAHHLRKLPYVDPDRIGLIGHSLGAEMAYKVAQKTPWVKALAIIGYAYTESVTFSSPKNMLMIIGQYDEFRKRMTGTRDITMEWMKTEQTSRAIDHPEPKFEVTYGNFEKGTARRVVVPRTIHILETHQEQAIAEMLSWMKTALEPPTRLWIDPWQQIAMIKEWATLIAMLAAFASIFPLGFLLLGLGTFQSLGQTGQQGKRFVSSRANYWKASTINAILMFLYPLLVLTIFGLHKYLIPIDGVFPMMVVNATVWWFMWINIIGFLLLRRWRRKQALSWAELGISSGTQNLEIDGICQGKTFLLAAILFLYIYSLEALLENLFITDFRFIFAFASDLTGPRLLLFLLYYPFLLIGFLQLSFFLHGQIRLAAKATPMSTFFSWTSINLLTLTVPVILLLAAQYIPLFTTGAIPFEGPGGVLVLSWINLIHILGVLMLVVPLSTWFFTLTERPYLSAFLNAAIVSWMFTSSQVIAPVPV